MPGILRELLVYICQECCRVQGTEDDCGERVCHRLPGNEPSPDLRGVWFIYFSPTGSLEAGSPRLGELSSDDATPGLSSVPRHLSACWMPASCVRFHDCGTAAPLPAPSFLLEQMGNRKGRGPIPHDESFPSKPRLIGHRQNLCHLGIRDMSVLKGPLFPKLGSF